MTVCPVKGENIHVFDFVTIMFCFAEPASTVEIFETWGFHVAIC
jgi:hypothetical protein